MTLFVGTGGHLSRNPMKEMESFTYSLMRCGKVVRVKSTDNKAIPYMELGRKLIVCSN